MSPEEWHLKEKANKEWRDTSVTDYKESRQKGAVGVYEAAYKNDGSDYNPVEKPRHYNLNHKGIECIDAMEAMLTPEEFVGYLRGNIFKYQWRWRYKNGLEDLAKARWYSNKLDEVLKAKPELTKRM